MSNGTMTTHSGHTGMDTAPTSGWITFAGSIMVIMGFFHAIAGLAALLKPEVFVATENQLLLFSYSQWGWVHLIAGIILVASAASLFAGQAWGRVVAVILATLSAILNFGFIAAYPLWSILIIAMDVMVIYAVITHGRQQEDY